MKYYVRTTVTLKFGQVQGYSAMMAKLVPYMAQHGRTLILGLQPFLGDLREITHVWEMERFEDIDRGLQACAADPEAHAILAPMPDLLINEAMQIMAKTSYSP